MGTGGVKTMTENEKLLLEKLKKENIETLTKINPSILLYTRKYK